MRNKFRCLFLVSIFLTLMFFYCRPAKAVTTNLRVALNCNLPAFQFINDKGKPDGMHVEILNTIADRKGFNIQYIPMETKQECLDALDSGEVDMILGAMMDKDSPYYYQFTDEISSSSLCLIAPNKIAQRISSGDNRYDYSISYEYGTVNYTYMSFIKAVKYIAVGNQTEVLEAQVSGETDAMIGIKNSLLYQLRQAGLMKDYTIVYNYMDTVKYAIIVRKGDTDLKRTLNSEIVSIHASSLYQDIYNKWIVNEQYLDISKLIKKVVFISIILVIGAMVYIIFSWEINRLLKKQVAEKTQKLQEANAQLQMKIQQIQNESTLRNLIIENSHTGMILVDENHTITLVNSSACFLCGLATIPAGEKVENVRLFHEILKDKIDMVFSDNCSMGNEIVTLTGDDGEKRKYRLNISQTVRDGDINDVLVMIEDVTEEERRKRELFEKEKTKSLNRIIAGIAHEIKNPLMSIRTFAALIGTKAGDREFQESFCKFVPGEVDRINRLIESLINYAKPVIREMECVDVKAIISECMYLTRPVIKKGSIVIHEDIEDNLHIKANKDQIKQVLINIIMNAIESMEKKIKSMSGEDHRKLSMNISARDVEGQVVISITDEGVGMNAKELRSCTDPFFTTKVSGTGLGLALSKVFVKENKGELSIESEETKYTRIVMKLRRHKTDES